MVLARRPAGMFARDDIAELLRAFAEEVFAVARAEGADPAARRRRASCSPTTAACPRTSARSMLFDAEAGRELEWEARNGVVRRLAARHGIPTPGQRRRRAPLGRGVRPDGIIRFMDPWVIWMIAAVVFAVGEIATLGFFLAPFAGGAMVAAIVSAVGGGDLDLAARVPARLGVLLAARRPLALSHRRMPAQLRTGTAALVGRTAMVTERIANDEGTGSVKLEGES